MLVEFALDKCGSQIIVSNKIKRGFCLKNAMCKFLVSTFFIVTNVTDKQTQPEGHTVVLCLFVPLVLIKVTGVAIRS